MQPGDELTNSPKNAEPEANGADVSIPAPLKIKKSHPVIWITGVVIMLLAIMGGMFYVLQRKAHENSKANTAPTIKTQKVDTTKLSPQASTFSVQNDKVIINGQLQADNSLVLTPMSEPSSAVIGLVYLDSSSKELRYYNGTDYVSLVTQAVGGGGGATAGVTSLQGASGALTLVGGSGLTVTSNGSQISLSLPQNLTTTASPTFADLTLSSLSANGVVITNGTKALKTVTAGSPNLCLLSTGGAPTFGSCVSGAVGSINGLAGTLTLQGTADQIIVSDNGIDTLTLSTPQNIAVTSSPTFAGLTVSSGGTLSGSSGAGLVTLPNETGKVCTSDLTVPVNDDCYSKFASASGSAAGYIQFAPAQVQEDHTCDSLDPCPTSTIYVGKTATSGNILRLQGWCDDATVCPTPQLQDVLAVQGTGELTFQSLQQSASAFSVLGFGGENIFNISTIGPTPAFLCTVDFESPQPPGVGDCADNDATLYLPFDQNPGNTSPATATSLQVGSFFFSGSNSLKIVNGTRTGGPVQDYHGFYLPYNLEYGETYTITFEVYHPPNGYANTMYVDYYRGASGPYGAGGEIPGQSKHACKNTNVPKNRWTLYRCSVLKINAADNGAQTNADGLIFRLVNNCQCGVTANDMLNGVTWYIDDMTLVKGSAVGNQTTLSAPFLINPNDTGNALEVDDGDNNTLFLVDSQKREVTVARTDNTDTPQTLPALYVKNDNGSAATFQSSISTNASPTVIIQGTSSQSQKLLSFQNSSGSELTGFTKDGDLVFHPTAGSANTGTLKVGSLTASRTYTLPNASGTICVSGVLCAGSGGSLQDAYNNSDGGITPEILLNGTQGAVDIQDASTTIGGGLFNIWASNADLSADTPLFSVNNNGTVMIQGLTTSLLTIKDSSANNVLTVSDTGELSIGNSNTTTGSINFYNSSNSNGVSLSASTPSGISNFVLPDIGTASATICVDTGNCAGSGGGITGSGTNGALAVFTGTGTIGDSTLSESGSVLTATGSLVVQGSGGLTLGTVSTDGKLIVDSSAGGSITLQTDTEASNETLTLPTGGGTLCTTVNIGTTCLSGGGGGSGGIVFLQGGNSFGATGTLGTNDSNSLAFETNNITRLTLDTSNDLLFNGGGSINVSTSTYSFNGGGTASGSGGAITLQGLDTSAGVGAGSGVAINAGNSGLAFGGNVNGAAITLQAGNGGVTTSPGTATGGSISLTAGAGGSSSGGILPAGGAITLQGGIATVSGAAGGAVTIKAGDSGGGAGSGGTLTLDSGVKTGAGTSIINLGTTNARTINIGNTTSSTGLTLQAGTGHINVGAQLVVSFTDSSVVSGIDNTYSNNGCGFGCYGSKNTLILPSGATGAVATGVYGIVTLTGTGAASTAQSLQADTITKGSGALTNAYGLYANAQSAAATLNVTAALEASTTSTLWLSSTTNPTTAAGGISFGSSRDTVLYRSAANTLKTDNTFNVNGLTITSSQIQGPTSGAVTVQGGNGSGAGTGGLLTLQGGTAGPNSGGTGGGVTVAAADGSAAGGGGNGGALTLQAGDGTGTNRNGGTLSISAGDATGTGTAGTISISSGGDLNASANNLSTGVINIATGILSSSTASLTGLTTGNITIQTGATTGNASDSGTTGSINLITGTSYNCGICGAAFNTTSGNINLDVAAGVSGGTNGSINIGAGVATGLSHGSVGDASAINLGSSGMTGTITVGQSTAGQTINIGHATVATGNTQTIQIGDAATGTGKNIVSIGTTNDGSTLTLQGGNTSSAVSIQSAASGSINVGTANAANTIQIGNTANAITQTINIGNNATGSSTDTITIGNLLTTSTTTIQGGTGASAISIQAGTSGTISIGTVNTLSVVIGKSDLSGTLTVNGNSTFNGTFTVNGHIISGNTSGSTTVDRGNIATCIVTGTPNYGSVSISGNDTAGTVTITTDGTGPCAAGGVLATVTFANAYGSAPRILLTPAETNGATLQYYNATSGTTSFTIDTNTAPATGTTYKYNYMVVQ